MDDESGTSAGVMFLRLGLDHFGQSAIPSLSTAFAKFYPCVNWWFAARVVQPHPSINVPHPEWGMCVYNKLWFYPHTSRPDFLQQLFAVLWEKDDTVQIKRGYVTVYSSHLGGATCCLCEICMEPGR